jgi:hypothetical protein
LRPLIMLPRGIFEMCGKVTHGENCSMAFGRKSPIGDCPRCDELRNGATPRAGYGDNKRRYEANQLASIAAHFAPGSPHSRGACGPVCTFGDW